MYYSFKKICFLTITSLSLSFISCSSEYDIDNEGSTVAQKGLSAGFNTDTRSYEEALTIAQNSISMVESSDNQTRSTSKHRSINEKGGVFTVSSSSTSTRTGNAANDTLLYVFNFNDDQGFAVVSANRNTEGLLAVTESGFYCPNTKTEIPGFNHFIEMAKLYVQNATSSKPLTRSGYPNYWKTYNDTLVYSRVDPKVQLKWGQRNIAGVYCSNLTAGCGPIAMALVMSYYQQPSSFTYNFPERDINYESLNWNLINQHIYTYTHPYNSVCWGNSNLDNTIGRICRHLGYKAGSNYYSDGSTGTSPGALYDVMTYYGYSFPGFQNVPNNENGFMDYLQQNKLIIMLGYNREDIGHFWIVDGGWYMKGHSQVYKSDDGTTWEFWYEYDVTEAFNHINWGWDGLLNGFFIHGIFDAASTIHYDPGSYQSTNEDLNYYRGTKYSTVYY